MSEKIAILNRKTRRKLKWGEMGSSVDCLVSVGGVNVAREEREDSLIELTTLNRTWTWKSWPTAHV